MNTLPVAIRDVIDDTPPPAVLRQQRLRITFAVLLVATTLFAIGVDEAKHWRPAVDLGLIVNDELDWFIAVPGGLAARAGVPERGSLVELDGVVVRDHFRDFRDVVASRLVVTRGGRVHAIRGTSTVTLRQAAGVEADVRAARCPGLDGLHSTTPTADGRDPCTRAPLLHTLVVDDSVGLVRDANRPWRSLPALPIAVLVAAVGGAAAGLPFRRRRYDADRLRRLRHRSIVWFAVAIAVVVPAWLHVAFLTLLQGDEMLLHFYELAVFTTVPGWLVLIVTAASAAARHADGDFTTSTRWWPFAIAVLPTALLLLLPGLGVVLTAVAVLTLLKHLDKAAIAREAPTVREPDPRA